jgi:hypothetical protein
MVQLVNDALSDYEGTEGTVLGARLADLAYWVVDYGLADYVERELEAPVAPEAPVVSPATIKLLVRALNANSTQSLGRDCDGVCNLRASAVRDGLIKEVDLYTCESCVDEPVEAPVVPIKWLGDDFDI